MRRALLIPKRMAERNGIRNERVYIHIVAVVVVASSLPGCPVVSSARMGDEIRGKNRRGVYIVLLGDCMGCSISGSSSSSRDALDIVVFYCLTLTSTSMFFLFFEEWNDCFFGSVDDVVVVVCFAKR